MRKTLLAVCVAAALLRAAPALAQGDGGPDPASVKVRLGPLLMNPAINISNIGVDNNVFNVAPDKGPVKDYTATITPTTDFWIHLGPTWVQASMNEQINWYVHYASERTANNEYKLGWNVPGSVTHFKVSWDYISARERPGFEIDARVARKQVTYDGSFDYRALSKTFIGVTASRESTRFADDAEFEGVNLNTSLSRVTTTGGLNLHHEFTPLTSLSIGGSRSRDHFEFSPDRDSTSTGASASLSFSPGGLFKGGLTVGYTNFRPDAPDLPGFSGVTGSVDLTYVLMGSTRFAITGTRAVNYSYDANQPYYVLTGFDLAIAQQLVGPFDVAVHGGRQILAYRDRVGVDIAVADRSDNVDAYGIGLGYHMGKNLRLAFNVDKVYRDSKVADRNYDNFKFGTALTAGF
ncbi:MAG TPA: outer membrane beta-barrel protein [Vicinamibacterales bacterium]|nr:outer membrane beta-barrel protein [Vicinamibacterales bacterium]